MKSNYAYGSQVRLIRNVRNDGTYPGLDTGAPLVRRGSVGFVQNVGTYLQDQIIYSVHFLNEDILVGCREEELIDVNAEWVPSKYEFRDKVTATIPLGVNGKVVVEKGEQGEVLKVLRNTGSSVQYHVRFPGKTLQVPEKVLDSSAQEIK